MVQRIVKMEFRPECIDDFLSIFEGAKKAIRSFDGCENLLLLQHRQKAHIFFTYSYWKDEASLEAYRNSELFEKTWANTKSLFSTKAKAWSLKLIEAVE